MGKAKLNVWVRDKHCRVIKRAGHVHLFNCLGEEVIALQPIQNGHAEVAIEPGCYIVVAGMWMPEKDPIHNINTDRTVVIVGCSDEACVNLVLPDFGEDGREIPLVRAAPEYLLLNGGCAARLILPLIIHANRKGIDPGEAIDVLIRTANIDRRQLAAALEYHAKDLKEHIKEIPSEKHREATEYMEILEKTWKAIETKEKKE